MLKKKININNIIIFLLNIGLSIILLFDTGVISENSYLLVSIYLIQAIILFIDYKLEKNSKSIIMSLISLWLAIFIYIYYYDILLIIFLPVCLSLYLFSIAIIYFYKDSKIAMIVTLLLSILLIVKPIFNVEVYLKITSIYLFILIIYYSLKRNIKA